MQEKSRSSIGLWFILTILAFAILSTCGTNNQTSAVLPGSTQGVFAGNTNQAATAVQYYDKEVTVGGQTFAPQFTTIPGLADGSQWLLAYWWENHEIVNGEGIDWGFFTPADGSSNTILMAKCFDPKRPNPTPGSTVYTYFVSEGLLKVPGNDTLQRFTPANGVINPVAPSVTPTQPSVAPIGTAPTSTPDPQGVLSTEERKGTSLFDQFCGIGAIALLIFLIWQGNKFLDRFRG